MMFTNEYTELSVQPTNGNPFISAEDLNKIVRNDWYLYEVISFLEAFYTGGSVPLGGAILWFGTEDSIPDNWAVCDGTNDMVDMRDVFVMGASEDGELKMTGGAETHVHEGGEVASAGSHAHSCGTKTTGSTPSSTKGITGSGYWISPNNHSHNISPTIGSGGGHVHEMGLTGQTDGLPPYKKLFWIARNP